MFFYKLLNDFVLINLFSVEKFNTSNNTTNKKRINLYGFW